MLLLFAPTGIFSENRLNYKSTFQVSHGVKKKKKKVFFRLQIQINDYLFLKNSSKKKISM